jgi:hypothetical protein
MLVPGLGVGGRVEVVWMSRAFFVVFLALSACTSGGDRPGSARDGGTDSGPLNRCDSMLDSDGDGLWDDYETDDDRDGDGLPNHLDTDSDGDGIPDNEERGDRGGCDARRSDPDTFPDYLDNDSDNDGLSDREERERYFTDPYSADSDGDGYTDTAEIATGHDPNDATDGLDPRDFYVVLPYMEDPEYRELDFGTDILKADVFFMMDRTGSMTGEVDQLRSGLRTLVTRIATTIPDIGVGFGGFEDFDVRGGDCMIIFGMEVCSTQYGADGDVPFELLSTITTDRDRMVEDVGLLRADGGGATWASSTEALYQAATGEGIGPWVPPQTCAVIPDEPGMRYGYPCFRPGALPILVVLTDTSSRNGPMTSSSQDYDASFFPAGAHPHTYMQALTALTSIGARVFGVISGAEVSSPTAAAQAQEWAMTTGTVDAAGSPIFFMISSDGTGLTDRVAEAIERLATETPMDISTRTVDGDDVPVRDPGVDARLFIKEVRPTTAFSMAGIEIPDTVLIRDDVAFYGVTPGTRVTFEVKFLNDFVPSMLTSQVFLAQIIVVGNGVADLDTREVVIVVPAGSDPLI